MLAFLMLMLTFSFVSANVIVSDPNPPIVSLNPYNPSTTVEFENLNLSENPTVYLTLDSSLVDVLQLSKTSFTMLSHYDSVIFSIKSTATGGTYSGYLHYDFGSDDGVIPINVVVAQEEDPVNYDIIVFPTSKIVNVQQGAVKTQSILIDVPANYPRTITVKSVTLEPEVDTIRFGDLNLGQIAPGNSLQIPIIFSGEEAQTGSYSTTLKMLATDSEGQINLPQVTLIVQVTAGTSPVTEDTFSTPPTCSLTATTFNLNNTYSFTCSNTVSNLDIIIPSSDYYTGKKVETSQNIYRYDFMPKKYGNTIFKAEFRYKGASIFDPFEQEIRITSSGSTVAGTDLRFSFTPKLEEAQDGEKVLIQLVDNKTGSLVSDPIVMVNALEINKTGDYSFEYSFVAETDYELRGKALGYADLVQTISINPQIINIILSPISGDTSTIFTINTSVENATLFINDGVVENPYSGTIPGGLNVIKAVRKGYTTTEKNLTVESIIRISSGGENFKKGALQTFFLTQNATWKVYYLNSMDATSVDLVESGEGTKIEFTPDKKGFYKLEADGVMVGPYYEIKGFSLGNKWGFMPAWAWMLIILVVIVIIIIVIAVKRNSSTYADDSGGGMMYPVGDGGQ